MSKYVVPEGMLKAFVEARGCADFHRGLEAAIGWQAENRPMPNIQQVEQMVESMLPRFVPTATAADWVRHGANEWVQRMFLAPELEVEVFDDEDAWLPRFEGRILTGEYDKKLSDGTMIHYFVTRNPEPEVSENDICEIGAALRDRKVRISNAEVGEILKAARSNRPAEPEEPLTFNGIPVRIDPSMNPNEPPRWENNPEPNSIVPAVKDRLCGCTLTAGEAAELMDAIRRCTKLERL